MTPASLSWLVAAVTPPPGSTAAATANDLSGWALTVAIAAASFTAWQALTAHWTRLADNEFSIVEWASAEWVAADVVEIRSNGPDVARRVWARLTIEGVAYQQRARRLRPGDALVFAISGHQVSWDWHEQQRPGRDEPSTVGTAFYYGGLISWRNRYGRRFSLPLNLDPPMSLGDKRVP